MMKIDVLTLFPEMFAPLNCSILGRAQEKGILFLNTHNIRDYSTNKHKTVDDYPFGGGAGMVMMCQPVFDCVEAVTKGNEGAHVIYMSPKGRTLTAKRATELASYEHIVILCGHYEGIDERIMTLVDEEISIGEYVLTGGELPAMVLIDSICRFIPEVLGSDLSALDESFSNGLLEYPQYTRPAVYNGINIPDVLLSGHHANIEKWRKEQSLRTTKINRPDLLEKAELCKKDIEFLAKMDQI